MMIFNIIKALLSWQYRLTKVHMLDGSVEYAVECKEHLFKRWELVPITKAAAKDRKLAGAALEKYLALNEKRLSTIPYKKEVLVVGRVRIED
jgi:hypothetical protein